MTDRPAPFTGNGQPTFTVRELLPWFAVSFAAFLAFLHWVG